MISGRDAAFPLRLCWAFHHFVERGVSMQFILIPSARRTAAIPEAALIPLVPLKSELRLRRAMHKARRGFV